MHLCTCDYVSMYIWRGLHRCLKLWIFTYVCLRINLHIWLHICMYICLLCLHIYMHIYAHMHIIHILMDTSVWLEIELGVYLWFCSCFFSLEDLCCLSRVRQNSIFFTIRWQLVKRNLKPTLLPTQGIFNLKHHGVRATDIWWCCKLYTAVKIQIGRGAGMGNWTANLQISSLTSEES